MQNKVKFKNILLTTVISTGLVLGAYFMYNRDIDRNKLNIESDNKVEDIKVKDKKEDRDREDSNNKIEARESEEERENRVATIVDNIRGEYRGIRRQPLRYNPIEVYKPPIANNNNPIELPSIPNNPSIPNTPDTPSFPVNPIIPTIPNPLVIPPDTDNPTGPGEDNGGDDNSPILVAGDRDPSFDTGVPLEIGFDGAVRTIAIQSNGKLVVGGWFENYQEVSANRIIRLNIDGSRDETFDIGTGFDSDVETLSIQSDGKILAGGWFSEYNGESIGYGIIRLNSDGSRDTSFNVGSGFGFVVETLAIQEDGKIVVGGWFTSYQGAGANRIIRLNADGSRDTSFNVGVGFDWRVYTLAIQEDGKIVVGGGFISYQGVGSDGLIRLNSDGSIDTSFNRGAGLDIDFNSYTLAIQSDGKIIVGGFFSLYQGVAVNGIIRLNADGSRDTTFNLGTGFSPNLVETLAIQSDGKIIVGGWFNSYQGVIVNRMVRLNADGSIDESFNIGSGFDNWVGSIAIQSDGNIVVGGWFNSYQGVTANRIIRLNADGSLDTSFNERNSFDNPINTLAIQEDGKIVVGGRFKEYRGTSANRIIRLNSDGSIDTSFNIGTGFNNNINTLAIQEDGKIVVGGRFSSYQGVGANYIIRLNSDGSRDVGFNVDTAVDYDVNTLAIQSDGKIVVGGWFGGYQGAIANHIIRLNVNGSIDNTFNIGDGFDSGVYTLAIQSDGKIIVGGEFNAYQGVGANYIIRLNVDGSRDNTFNIEDGFDSDVSTLAIQSDGKIIVGGWFNSYQGVGANYIIRLNVDGSRDNTFNIGDSFDSGIGSISIQLDGRIVVGGWFNSYQGVGANYIIRLNVDGSRDNTFNIGDGFDDGVNTLSLQSDGKIIVGGWFTNYQVNVANVLIRIKN